MSIPKFKYIKTSFPDHDIYNYEIDWIPTVKSNKIQPAPNPNETDVAKDYVNEPVHYQIFPDAQVIDLIRKTLTPEEFKGFCKGNILKYRLRDKQDQREDYEKSKKYQKYLQDFENL